MGWIIAAGLGGFFVGALVFVVVGAAWGYANAVRHLSAVGTVILQNAAASQKPQMPVADSTNPATRFN
jgi:hypothetical protein